MPHGVHVGRRPAQIAGWRAIFFHATNFLVPRGRLSGFTTGAPTGAIRQEPLPCLASRRLGRLAFPFGKLASARGSGYESTFSGA